LEKERAMERLELTILIAGGLVPFVVSILKRWFVMTKEQASLVTMIVCFVVTSVIEFFSNGFDFNLFLTKIVTVYGTSQVVYWSVIKTLDFDTRIEGK
jgi:hypothetical protein